VLAWLRDTWSYGEMFGFGAVAVALCLTVVAFSSRTALPGGIRR
jgi:hypothetical protein